MVQIRKPVQLSQNLIDARKLGTNRMKRHDRAGLSREMAKRMLEEAMAQAHELRKRRPR